MGSFVHVTRLRAAGGVTIALWQYTNGADGPRDKTLYPRRTGGFAKTGQDRSAFFGTADELAAWWASAGR
jgi:hypothetical protein